MLKDALYVSVEAGDGLLEEDCLLRFSDLQTEHGVIHKEQENSKRPRRPKFWSLLPQ